MDVLSVVGARPQFVKAFPVSDAVREHHDELLVHTGQHYDEAMSEVFFRELPIPEPDVNLGVGSDTHATQTAAMLRQLDVVVADYAPDVLLVYGDTNSTLAGALVGAKRDCVVAHVEAGLRSYDRRMPEEINRVLTDHCSGLLFVPSDRAEETLAEEGITDGVYNTGDVMYDSLLAVVDRAREQSTVLDRLGYDPGEFVLATVHRAKNTDDPDRLANLLAGLGESPHPVVLPAHPRTAEALRRQGLAEDVPERVRLIEPVGYLDFVALVDAATQVATDSGGVQKEAFYLDTPVVTLREETEWVETVTHGWNVLVGTDPEAIARTLQRRRPCPSEPKPEPYGDGTAAERILGVLETEVVCADPGADGGTTP